MRVPGADTAIVEVAGAESRLVEKAKQLQGAASMTSWELADIYVKLKKKHGWTGRRIAEECGVSETHVSRFTTCAEKFALAQTRPPFWEAYREADSKGTAHVSQNTGQVEWYTPPEFIDAARAVMGGIDLDPATSELAQKTVGAADYYTADDDGLEQAWAGRVWMNPPYAAGLVDRFASKLCDHINDGTVTAAIMLVNNSTDTGWFQLAAKHSTAICFPNGRIKFIDEQGDPRGAPLQGQAILYFGENRDLFVEQFSAFGFCAKTGGP